MTRDQWFKRREEEESIRESGTGDTERVTSSGDTQLQAGISNSSSSSLPHVVPVRPRGNLAILHASQDAISISKIWVDLTTLDSGLWAQREDVNVSACWLAFGPACTRAWQILSLPAPSCSNLRRRTPVCVHVRRDTSWLDVIAPYCLKLVVLPADAQATCERMSAGSLSAWTLGPGQWAALRLR